MEVRIFPSSHRPGVGVRPRRESHRPLLPQHARHCPVLEAGSELGFLVYPPLEPSESFYVDFQGEGRYRFVYYLTVSGTLQPIFGVEVIQPVGGAGLIREEVTFLTQAPMLTRELALLKTRTLLVPEDLGTPSGGLSLRGAWNFKTPPGWDTVYTPIFNVIERPIPPMLVIRVETDWYAHETEFRYVLQAGEGISVEHNLPIGQVMFMPREEITLRDCDEEEVEVIRQFQREFSHEKAATKLATPYGLPYSPHYLRLSRSQRQGERQPSPVRQQRVDSANAPVGQSQSAGKPGRNDPCPCGSGKKYKKCHGVTT
jgi:hypothetical protein